LTCKRCAGRNKARNGSLADWSPCRSRPGRRDNAFGALNPRSQLFGATICRTASPLQLALTFDDGPNPAITPKLLDLLDRFQVKATFFVIGRFVRQCGALTKEIAERGHLLANHTETHPNLFLADAERGAR
jgi:peptidoglycan/xylan/chitin deacetylase (PgdA/CDA1 family)